jgi:fructokinase
MQFRIDDETGCVERVREYLEKGKIPRAWFGLISHEDEDGITLPPEHPAWALEANYLGLGLVNLICTISPQRVIFIWGDTMQRTGIFRMIRQKVQESLNAYLQVPAILEGIGGYIVPPHLGNRAGASGAIQLAKDAVKRA